MTARRGRTGNRRLPSDVKRGHGERRSSRLNPREPRPQAGAPPRPRLGKVAAAEWARLVGLTSAMKILTTADGPALEAVAIAYEDLVAARRVLTREGRFYTVTTKSGDTMKRAHPAVRVAAEAWRRYTAGLALFGLGPALRGKVQTVPEVEQDEVNLWLIQGGKRGQRET